LLLIVQELDHLHIVLEAAIRDGGAVHYEGHLKFLQVQLEKLQILDRVLFTFDCEVEFLHGEGR